MIILLFVVLAGCVLASDVWNSPGKTGGNQTTPTPEATATPTPVPTQPAGGPWLTDRSGMGNNGMVYGTRSAVAPNGSQVRSFNGVTDYVSTANFNSLNPTGGLTVEALFKIDQAGRLQTIVGKSWSGPSDCGYTLWVTPDDQIEFFVYGLSQGKVAVKYDAPVVAGQWYYVSATHDGSVVSLYLNGVKVASKACGELKPSNLDLTIGRYSPRDQGFLEGDVAMVRVYGRGLTAQEVVTNYNADRARAGLKPVAPEQPAGASVPVAAGMVLWYDFSEPISTASNSDTNVSVFEHPYLVFNDIRDTPGYQHSSVSPWSGWQSYIMSDANAALSVNYASSSGADEAQRGIYAQQLGMAYQITKDSKYSARARDALLHIGTSSVLGPSSMMSPEGFRAISLEGYLFAYDWIQPTLDAASDKTIRDNLARLADKVYYECYSDGPDNVPFVDQLGQSYPILGIAGVCLADYTNPNGLSLKSDPAEWRRVGTDYLFVHDPFHWDGRALVDYEIDPEGRDLLGSYKLYYLDDFAWWAQVYTRYYGKNFFDVYPRAKQLLIAEIWTSLPNYYDSNFVANGNLKVDYHRGIVNLLDPANQSYVLNFDDTIEQSSELKYSSYASHIYYNGYLPDALLYSFYGDYSSVPRRNPPYTSILAPDAADQVFREGWTKDSDWLSLVTFNKNILTSTYRNMQHHDQLSFEYYAKGDLLLADAGEDRHSTDNYKGEYEVHHNTIAIEDPRSPFSVASWSGSTARGAYKGNPPGLLTPVAVQSAFSSSWMDLVDASETIKDVIGSSASSYVALSSPIQYERTVLYPEKDYFIVVDRMEGTQPWVYRNIFRPTSFSITPSSGLNIGHVNGVLKVGGSTYDWQSLGYKKESSTGIKTSSLEWSTTNVYGNAVNLQIYTVPASDVLATKNIGRIGGYNNPSEVYNPVMYFRSPAQNNLYRATVLLPAYQGDEVRSPSTIPVNGTGNALKVASSGYDDYVYTGKGTSSFASFATDANIAFVRVNGQPTEYTLVSGSQLDWNQQPLVYASGKMGALSVKFEGNTIRIQSPDTGPLKITLCQLDPSVRYQVEVNGVHHSNWVAENGNRIAVVTLN